MSIQVEVKQISASAAEGTARNHRVLVDRPAEKGGEDQGMMGGEYLLVALGGCFMSNLLAAIKAREAEIKGVQLKVIGTLESAPSRFSDIEVQVSAEAEDRAQLEKLVEMADRACISSNTLRRAANVSFTVL